MKKHLLIALTLSASTLFMGCQNDSSSGTRTAQPGYPPVQDYDGDAHEYSIHCKMKTINAYNQVIRDAADFSWDGDMASLRSLLASCARVREEFYKYDTGDCWALDLASGSPILINELDIRDTCEMANEYGGSDGRTRSKASSKSGKQRAQDFNIEKIQGKKVQKLESKEIEVPTERPRSERRPRRTEGTQGN